MDAEYAHARSASAHLAFRLRCRAAVVVHAVRWFGTQAPVRLLEVGAAEGRTLLELAGALGRGEFIGIEYDEGLRTARPPLPANVTLVGGDAMSLPPSLEARSFDVVSMLAILEHLPDPLRALAEAFRVLRPGGLLVATCPNPFWDTVAERLRLVDASHHVNRIDLPKLRMLIESVGFDTVSAGRFMWAPLAVLPYARIPVTAAWALRVDAVVDRIPLLGRLCVNAYVIGRRPDPSSSDSPSRC